MKPELYRSGQHTSQCVTPLDAYTLHSLPQPSPLNPLSSECRLSTFGRSRLRVVTSLDRRADVQPTAAMRQVIPPPPPFTPEHPFLLFGACQSYQTMSGLGLTLLEKITIKILLSICVVRNYCCFTTRLSHYRKIFTPKLQCCCKLLSEYF